MSTSRDTVRTKLTLAVFCTWLEKHNHNQYLPFLLSKQVEILTYSTTILLHNLTEYKNITNKFTMLN